MDSEARLMRALGASAAPTRDPAFTLAVMRESEARRYRRESVLSLLRTAGMAGAAGALLVPLLGWLPSNAEAVQQGAVTAGALVTLVLVARLMSQRVAVGAR